MSAEIYFDSLYIYVRVFVCVHDISDGHKMQINTKRRA